MQKNIPFGRAISMMNEIRALMTLPTSLQQIELQKLGSYESRGHGGKHRAQAKFGFAFSQLAAGRRNKYQPHQGKKEIARRLGKMSLQ